ncbi:Nuclear hormone receptor HR96 [Gossypium arboreum]|uniref:Nuclear hormone receptor HR96 n=1 Tax=Gossypium arboreum TaxID=29729 RepID=A0A0B0N112_GOSAR|nr:Nuclear hormone receptor HR96 [Gossypium arboreum]
MYMCWNMFRVRPDDYVWRLCPGKTSFIRIAYKITQCERLNRYVLQVYM